MFGPPGLKDYGSAMVQNLIPSFPWIAPGWRAWGLSGKERKGSNFAIWQPWVKAVKLGTLKLRDLVGPSQHVPAQLAIRDITDRANFSHQTFAYRVAQQNFTP